MTSDDRSSRYTTVYNPLKVGCIDGIGSIPHDNGIIRATTSVYRPNPSLTNNPKSTLFVARLDKDVVESDIEKIFSRHGELKSVTIVRDVVTGFSKKYGFVEFKDPRDTEIAQRKEHNTSIKGRVILVDYQHQHNLTGWIPRRLGGGFGGRKESGQLRFGCIDRPWKKPITNRHYEVQSRSLSDVNNTYSTRAGPSTDEKVRQREEYSSRRKRKIDDHSSRRESRRDDEKCVGNSIKRRKT